MNNHVLGGIAFGTVVINTFLFIHAYLNPEMEWLAIPLIVIHAVMLTGGASCLLYFLDRIFKGDRK